MSVHTAVRGGRSIGNVGTRTAASAKACEQINTPAAAIMATLDEVCR